MENFNDVVVKVAAQMGISPEALEKLIRITNDMESNGAKYARVNEYGSDVSDNTESASHTVVLNINYGNMVKQEREALDAFDISQANVDAYDYNRIDLDGKSVEEFKSEVRAKLEEALTALKGPKKQKDTSADVWLNPILVFNLNTVRLSLVGQGVRKDVVEQGEFHKPKSKPLTVAKDIIRYQAGCRTSKYRRYAIDNFNGNIRLQGETLEING
jgi:hypothetical protein